MRRSGATVPARQRLAAITALVLSVVLVVLVVGVLILHGLWVVLGLAGLGLAVGGAWWFVTERPPRRLFGCIGMVAGLLVIALSIGATLAAADRFLFWFAILVVVFACTVACARAAMVHELHEIDTATKAGGRRAPRRAVLLCNPKSGGGKVDRFGLVALAHELGVEPVVLGPEDDLEQLARAAVARGADCLGMAGGDGSQALVASIAVEHDLPFVCVSAGTRNHFALDLGLPRDDPRTTMYAFRDAVERRVDFATVNDRLFVNNVSLGVYADIVQQESYRDAKFQTTTTMLPEMLGRRAEPFDLQFTTPSGEDVDGAILLMVSNNPYVITASPDMAERRGLDTGELGVFAVTTRTGSEAARLFVATAVGERTRSRYWKEFAATNFEVRSRSATVLAGVDGEALELQTPLHFEIHPGGLHLLVPHGNVAAAAKRRARSVDVRELLALATGRTPARLE